MADDDLYNVLGVSKDASDDDIKKAFHKSALKFHPDKNTSSGAKEKYSKISNAHNILSDKERRLIYDKYGLEGLLTHPTNEKPWYHNSEPDIGFKRFFGYENILRSVFTGGYRQRSQSIPQNPTIYYDLEVGLEDINKGCTKKMKITRTVLNPDRKTTSREEKILTIDIKPGWKAGTEITFLKEGDQYLSSVPADITFVLRDKKHGYFKREGCNLRYTAKLALENALCGTTMHIPTLDHDQTIDLQLEGVTSPHTVKRMKGEGLPCPKDPTKRGDIIVNFDIIFPDRLDESTKDSLRYLLEQA